MAFEGMAYDHGLVFTINYSGLLRAFDATTGITLWLRQLPNEWAFTGPPTARGGLVYVGGAGDGGILYAVSEANGAIAWMAGVANGDESSPVVTPNGVYVSYSCQQVYRFAPATGSLIWHHTTGCGGGGGATPSLFGGRLYVRDLAAGPIILDAPTGSDIGTFTSETPPVNAGSRALEVAGGALSASDPATGSILWEFAGDGSIVSPPVVVGGAAFVASERGIVYQVRVSDGAQLGSTDTGGAYARSEITGLAEGEGLLAVPMTNTLVAFG
jgi:outer membrane protein assembly factor BamB